MAASLGLSKVFILDKYFTELQKFWETEKKLQGIYKSYKLLLIRSCMLFFWKKKMFMIKMNK